MATFILKNTTNSAPVTATGQLEFNTDKKTLVVGDGTNQVVIAKMNVENEGSFLLTGDVKLSGSIYLGDVAADNIAALGTFTTNLIPNTNNSIDVGSTSRYWRNIYATSISGAIAATNGVISGSSQIVGILPAGTVSGSSQIVYSNISGIPSNIVSASTDTANVDITITNGNISAELKGGVVSSSAQIIDVIESLNAYTSSNNTKWSTLQNVTASLINFTGSQNTINAGYNSYTQSTDSRLNNLESKSGSVDISISNINTFTESVESRFNTLGTYTASVESRFGTIATLTGSIASEQTAQNNRLTKLEESSGSVNDYTASLKTAIDVTGGNTTIKGNLIVAGTTTAVQSTTLNVADKNIVIASGSLNSAASDGAGITIDGAGVSMSWSDTNSRIELNKPFAVLGAISASTIDGLNGATVLGYSTSVDSRLSNIQSFTQSVENRLSTLATYTGSVNIRLSNLETTSASVSTSISNINAFTASENTKSSTLGSYTSSLEERMNSLATITGSLINSASAVSQSTYWLHQFSASQLTQNSDLGTYTASVESRFTTLATTTGSINISISNLNQYTASVSTSVSNINTYTASVSTSIGDLNNWSASVKINVTNIHNFTASVSSSLLAIQQSTASLNLATASLYASASSMTESIAQLRSDVDGLVLTSDVAALGASVAALKISTGSLNLVTASLHQYTHSTNIRLDNLELTSASLNAWSSSLNTTFATDAELAAASGAISSSLYLLSQSVDNRFTTLGTYTGSNDTKWSTLGTQSGSWVTEAESGSFLITASYAGSTLTFTKGNNQSFNLEISTGSAVSASLAERALQIDVLVKNVSGAQIDKGKVVRISGATGDNPLIVTASFLTEGNSANTLGITTQNIPNDSFGYVVTEGILLGVDTSGMTAGQLLYLGANGTFTTTPPTAPNHGVRLGEVLREQQVNGSIYVRIDNGSELGEAHDVVDSSTNSSYGDVLMKSGSVWINNTTFSSSISAFSSSTNVSLNNINSYTASLKTAITIAGSDVTLNGNLTVAGTTTTINSTTVQLGDNIIELNGTGAANGGLRVKDPTAANTISGSLLWDSTNDYWIGGALGAESKLLRAGGDSVVTSSAQINIYDVENFSTFNDAIAGDINAREPIASGTHTLVSGSSQISYAGLSNIPSGIVSGSSQITGITNGQLVNSTITIAGTSTALGSSITLATITAGSGIISGSGQLGNYETTGRGIVSGSSQIVLLLPAGTISGSSQVAGIGNSQLTNSTITIAGTSVSLGNSITLATITGNSGIISGSGQLTGYETTGRGIVSGSSQVTLLLPTGTISGSTQLTTEFDTRYLNTGGDSVFSSSAQIGNYVATITGTSNQIVVAGSGNNAAAITLSTPQNIHTSATPQFGSLGIGTAASGVTGEIRATGDITAFYSSDERLKENITPIQNALEKVEAISGNTYDWKDGFETIHSHKGHDLGVIAQEVQSILPEVVTERDNGYLAVDYIKLVPVLIQAVKELSAKVKELESK